MDALGLAQGIFGIDPQTLLLIAVVLILAAMLWHNARRRAGSSRSSRVDGRASQYGDAHNLRRQFQAREDIDELMVRLEELSREICGQIDTRFAKLESVIAEADRKIAALRRAQLAVAPPEDDEPADPRHEQIWTLHTEGAEPVEIAAQMDMPVGEVELVLSLERARRASRGQADETADSETPAAKGKGPAKPSRTRRIDKRA